jgi:DNA helicase II / ATP-dependent DNA helicase PcrA
MTAARDSGVLVMNMHKAKGKQVDEVIVFEAWPRTAKGKIAANLGRFVPKNDLLRADDQCRQNLRVSITRGKLCTTILTPASHPCVLLPPK